MESFKIQTTKEQPEEYRDPAHVDDGPDVMERPEDVPEPTTPPTTEAPEQEPVEPTQPSTEKEETVQQSQQEQPEEYRDPAHVDDGPDVMERPEDVPEPTTPPTTEAPEQEPVEPAAPSHPEEQTTSTTSPSETTIDLREDQTEDLHTETITEQQDKPDQLAETGSETLPAGGVIGGAALAMGATAVAAKRIINRKQR